MGLDRVICVSLAVGRKWSHELGPVLSVFIEQSSGVHYPEEWLWNTWIVALDVTFVLEIISPFHYIPYTDAIC